MESKVFAYSIRYLCIFIFLQGTNRGQKHTETVLKIQFRRVGLC